VGLSFLAFSFFFSLLFFYHVISSFQSDTFGRIPHLKPYMSLTRDPSTLVAFFGAFHGADSSAASPVLPGSSAPMVPVNGRGSVYPHPDDRPVACYLTYPIHVSMTPLTSLNTTLHDELRLVTWIHDFHNSDAGRTTKRGGGTNINDERSRILKPYPNSPTPRSHDCPHHITGALLMEGRMQRSLPTTGGLRR
jgi:hypothetical protein